MSRHIIAVFTALCFMVMIFASGFGICIIPKTTEILASYINVKFFVHAPAPQKIGLKNPVKKLVLFA